jgi:hypothetical protein
MLAATDQPETRVSWFGSRKDDPKPPPFPNPVPGPLEPPRLLDPPVPKFAADQLGAYESLDPDPPPFPDPVPAPPPPPEISNAAPAA